MVTTSPPGQPGPLLDDAEETYCYAHTKTPTKLRCSRCNRPICGRCAIPASVGQHCPECVAEARKSTPKVRTALAVNAPATRVILAITIAFYVIDRVTGLVPYLASFPPAIAGGEFWRLLTPVLLHGSLIHIGLNMYILYIYGPIVEQNFGTARFIAMYLISGVMGGAASYTFSSCRSVGVGASGAIFGLAGILLIYAYNRRKSVVMGTFLGGIRFFIIANLLLGLFIPRIDNFAHLGGLVGGVLLGLGFDDAESKATPGRQLATGLGVLALGVGLVAFRTATFTCGV